MKRYNVVMSGQDRRDIYCFGTGKHQRDLKVLIIDKGLTITNGYALHALPKMRQLPALCNC